MSDKNFLGEFEQMVLLAILQRSPASYGPTISEELERRAGRTVSRGALYSSLGRLEKKGLLRWQIESPTPERGGHPRRRFEVTHAGVKALKASRSALVSLWTGLEHVLGTEAG
jgi:DNA-binding PadR family transcriptional regulator